MTLRKLLASQKRDRFVVERFTKRWGTVALDHLSSKMLEDYLTQRLDDVTWATVSKELGQHDVLPWIALNQEGKGVDFLDHAGHHDHPAPYGHLNSPHLFTQSDGRPYGVDQVGIAVIRTATQAQLPGVR